MAENIKILVTGSTNGHFRELFAKSKQINEKYGPFDVHLCVGNFVGDNVNEEAIQALLDNKIDVPIMTYFILGDKALPQALQQRLQEADMEVCNNLYFLGQKGILTTSEGIKIAFLSGVFDEAASTPNSYTRQDVRNLCMTKMPVTAPPGVDILITFEWPQQITELTTAAAEALQIDEQAKSSVNIAELATALKPRYHFAASQNKFYERQPYKNIMSGLAGKEERAATHVTRFIGLGDVLNNDKQRWFYAFNLLPLSKATKDVIDAAPENTTDNPFISLLSQNTSNKRKMMLDSDSTNGSFFWGGQQQQGGDDPSKRMKVDRKVPKEGYVCKKCNVPGHYIQDCPQKAGPPEGYICRICNEPGHFIQDCPKKEERPQRPAQQPVDLSACWFCLSNPNLDKHLIVSIGSEAYLTLAKGPVVPPNNSECTVPGLGHALIMPINHYSRLNQIPPTEQDGVLAEIEKYKSALKQLYAQFDQDLVTFEVSRDSGRNLTHAHVQVVPIPKSKSDDVEKVAREKAAEAGMVFENQVPQNPNIPYFKMELPNGTSLVYLMKPRERFNLQFGRLVVAHVLGVPDRVDWKICSQPDEEEKRCTEAFRNAFKPFDFNEA